ncbi:DUF943 family protein [Vibrio rhizosphaerae]|uniref:DUF943 family protein n=1 Tax=Vibrio rhizosphaerae TaxID=398736 RepID=A0ABU4IQ29_9VIBR|nr:DUF943 family protein [Vibrio rhizosphaerae]MDW6091243.1 DUF943 family protein [Vibrio rhizosphaerae]
MNKKSWVILTFIFCGLLYFGYQILHPVEIVDVHQDKHWTDIVVKNFPVTRRGKIQWWKENQSFLKEKYGIPKPFNDGTFEITFWDIGSGYRVDRMVDQDSDLLCFKDMDKKANCIEKNQVFSISMSKNMGLQYQ